MDSYLSQIVNVVLAVIVTFALNTGLSYLASDNGSVTIGRPLDIQETSYQPLEISNYSGETIDGLSLLLPESTEISSIIVSDAIKMEFVKTAKAPKGRKLFELSGIKTGNETRILIPNDKTGEACCEFTNLEDLRFTLKNDTDVKNPINEAISESIRTALIYGVMVLLFALWVTSKFKKLSKLSDERSERLDRIEERHEVNSKELHKDLDEIRLLNKRQRMYLLKRITDYSKEIKFWRNTVHKILIEKITPEEIEQRLRVVSKNLDTRSTHGKIEEEYNDFKDLSSVVMSINEQSKI
ncbi:hypothetical protein [Vibrio aestuarianus]|uniref:Uncharacterized protein n=1 Tax=Vibrio aestuarianus TaxID=28171 RepID=A0ABD7YSA8_9VIBR|nr:hypothetical protein [Vibrio aestuarianus]WGK87352.1 hypothetical protein PYE67_14610 [Vibrio aestuarianus]CAH8210271.1 hypothetical protein VAEU17_320002 [Vibrio aestuarianus]